MKRAHSILKRLARSSVGLKIKLLAHHLHVGIVDDERKYPQHSSSTNHHHQSLQDAKGRAKTARSTHSLHSFPYLITDVPFRLPPHKAQPQSSPNGPANTVLPVLSRAKQRSSLRHLFPFPFSPPLSHEFPIPFCKSLGSGATSLSKQTDKTDTNYRNPNHKNAKKKPDKPSRAEIAAHQFSPMMRKVSSSKQPSTSFRQ